MKKTFAILAVSSLIVTGAFAGPQKAKTTKTPKTISCAVEKGNMVNIADATKKHMYADYKGNRYFFCCNGCPQQFKANPAKFAKNSHIPTPKAVAAPAKKKH